MSRFARTAAAATLLVSGLLAIGPGAAGTQTAAATASASSRDVTGYVEDQSGAVAAIKANKGSVTSVGLDTSDLTNDGRGITAPDTGPVSAIHAIGARAEFLVSNYGPHGFSPSLAATTLEKGANRQAVALAIAAAVRAGHWDGATIDFESLYTRDRADLVTFVRQVRVALPKASILAVDLPASASGSDPYIAPYDYKALAAAADDVVLMAYDEHYQGSTPGPVAGRPWVGKCLQVALAKGVPAAKMQLGEAGYGYRWYPARPGQVPPSTQVSVTQAPAIAARNHVNPIWDAIQQEWHVTLPDGSVMWWSDARSMAVDTALATDHHLRGVAVWQLLLSGPLPPL